MLLKVDLIDMRSCTDQGYNWIGHYKDHFSKFSIIWSQKKKCATETIGCMEILLLHIWGCQNCCNQIMEKNLTMSLAYQLHVLHCTL